MSIQYKASDFIDMKSRVKAEVKRRSHTGSVASYGEAAYDYSVQPVAGQPVKSEHYNKIAEPLRAINTDGVAAPAVTGQDIESVTTPTELDAKITLYASRALTSASINTGCAASCTGLCSSTCTGTCAGGCTNTCSGCSGGCSGSCTSCSGCSGGCDGCSNWCSQTCGNCGSGCSGNCSGGCDGCSGCGGSCAIGCGNSCSGGCWLGGTRSSITEEKLFNIREEIKLLFVEVNLC